MELFYIIISRIDKDRNLKYITCMYIFIPLFQKRVLRKHRYFFYLTNKYSSKCSATFNLHWSFLILYNVWVSSFILYLVFLSFILNFSKKKSFHLNYNSLYQFLFNSSSFVSLPFISSLSNSFHLSSYLSSINNLSLYYNYSCYLTLISP